MVFDAGNCPADVECTIGLVNGSYFTTDNDGDGAISSGEITLMTPGTDGGVIIGQIQSVGEIDVLWDYFGNTGGHVTTSPITH